MKTWTKFSLAGIGLTGAGFGLAFWSGASSWNSATDKLIEQLEKSALTSETKTVSFDDLDLLPAPVARYFRLVLKDGQPIIRTAHLKHGGEFRLNEKWIPFTSNQNFSAAPPGFVWDALMQMNSLMNVRVRDAYANGKGSMLAKISSLVPVMDAHDDPKLDAGALQRYLAEAVWLPTALLPGENLKWSAIDENRALATLTDSGTTISLEFRFNETGEITEVFSPGRYRETAGRYELAAWAGRFWDYREINGMRIPLQGEVEWQLPVGNLPYWRGRITAVEYCFAK